MLLRILTIREHKTVFFCDVCGKNAKKHQLMIEKKHFPNINIQIGAVLEIDYEEGISKSGNHIIIMRKLNNIFLPSSFSPYKSFQEYSKLSETGELPDINYNILNGGKAMALTILKQSILQYVDSFLFSHGINKVYTPITTPYRGTSIAEPQKAEGKYTGHRYIKITHEIGLKIISYLMLQSVYEIGYVCRDRYETQKNLNEFLTVEGIIIASENFNLADFFYNVWDNSIKIADSLGVAINNDMRTITRIDFCAEYGSKPLVCDIAQCEALYKKIINANKHFIIVNAPIDSPFVYSNEGELPLETKWIYSGKGIGHGYNDEYRVENVYKAFECQKNLLAEQGVKAEMPLDYLEILSSAGIPTNSFVIGIERLVKNIGL